jgi:16S rRNA C967 or C1407 C5-methylase (RsmB/RsmF family)
LTDILIGAIAYHVNGHIHANDASAAKVDIAQHVMDRAGVKNPTIDTSIGGKFTIWHRRLRPRGGVPRR